MVAKVTMALCYVAPGGIFTAVKQIICFGNVFYLLILNLTEKCLVYASSDGKYLLTGGEDDLVLRSP